MTVHGQITIDGITALAQGAEGMPVVFLHGIGSNASSFAGVFRAMPRTQRLIAWNAPGYGGSDPLSDPDPSADAYAAALLRFLDAAGVARACLVGHSLGTLIGAAFARAHPDRVAHLLLVSCAQGQGARPGDPLPGKAADRLKDLDRLGPAAFARERAAALIHRPEDHPDLVAQVETAMAAIDPGGYAQAVRMLAKGDLSGTLAATRCAASFLIGAEDGITPPAQTEAAAAAWSAANGRPAALTVVPGVGHALPVQAPGAVATAVAAALRPLPGATDTPTDRSLA